jgi:hypothetical protein
MQAAMSNEKGDPDNQDMMGHANDRSRGDRGSGG